MNNTIVTHQAVKPDNCLLSATVRTHEEVANILGVNERTVRRIEKNAIKKLTKKLMARGYGVA